MAVTRPLKSNIINELPNGSSPATEGLGIYTAGTKRSLLF